MFQAVTFHLCKILNKILHHFFRERVNASDRADQNRRIIEVVRPFEPSSTVVHPCTTVEGEFCVCTKHRCCMEPLPSLAVLVEQPPLFCGDISKTSDAFTLQPLKEYRYGDAETVCP